MLLGRHRESEMAQETRPAGLRDTRREPGPAVDSRLTILPIWPSGSAKPDSRKEIESAAYEIGRGCPEAGFTRESSVPVSNDSAAGQRPHREHRTA